MTGDTVASSIGQTEIKNDFGKDYDSCWFNLRDSEGTEPIEVNSYEFALSTRSRGETTYGLAQPTTSFASTVTPTSIPATPTDEGSTGTPTNDGSDDGGGGLSTGAQAGIGVGVGVGVLGLAALAGAFWLVRKRKSQNAESAAEMQGLYTGEAAGRDNKRTPPVYQRAMSAPPSELESQHGQHELPGSDNRHGQHELPG